MLSINQTKLIRSLKQKKFRDKTGVFVAEGPKVIAELMAEGLELHSLFTLEDLKDPPENHCKVSEIELKKISFLTTPNSSLAVFKKPNPVSLPLSGLIVALDAIRDPGNLGTIIRLCDWFGVVHLICSLDTADCYNPKVVQASMGSLARVHIHYMPMSEYLTQTKLPIYGGCMDAQSIYTEELPKNAILVMGNEANGISSEIMECISHKISIPRFGINQRAESLNVATATAVLLSEFRRSTGK